MPTLVDIQNLDFAYGQQLVLKHIDLAIEAGSTLGIIGPNGGGKTTLMRLLLGLYRPRRGHITIAGLTPRQAIARGDLIGYLPQLPRAAAGFPMNVRQVVQMGLVGKTGMLRSFSPIDLRFVEELLEKIGLRSQADVPVGELSGGQQQRVFIARALAPRPKLLLLDEPTTGVDRAAQQLFIDSLQDLQRTLGLTVVLSSHDLRAVSAIADRIACLNLTLHYHDRPQDMPPELVYRMFACDLAASGLAARPAIQGAPS